MTDHPENQAHQGHTGQEILPTADEEDFLSCQLRKIEECNAIVHEYAQQRSILRPAEEDEAITISREVFGHEIKNVLQLVRHGVLLSPNSPIPEKEWGEVPSPERDAFLANLGKAWPNSNTKLRDLKAAMLRLHFPHHSGRDLEDIFSDEAKSAYVGMYFSAELLYPHHTMDVKALRTMMLGFRNVMEVFMVPTERRAHLLTEIQESTVTVGDFFTLFPDKHLYLVEGDLNRQLNQFEINLLFEMLNNAKKYNVGANEPIEVFIAEEGSIEVKNRSVSVVDFESATLGKRGPTSGEQNGHGFGIFKMKTIADLNGQEVCYSKESLGEVPDSPPYQVTCSLKKVT